MRQLIPAKKLYLMTVGIHNLAVSTSFTIFAIYLVRNVGVNPFQLVFTGTVFEATIFLFEIPTGIVADVYSRRLSVIIGYAMLGLGIIITSTPQFAWVILGMFVMGVGSTFISGALSAWIVDEVGHDVATQAFLQGTQTRLILGLVGTALSILLSIVSLPFAILCSGLILVSLSIFLIIVMPEEGFQRSQSDNDASSRGGLFSTFRQGVSFIRAKRILFWILLVTFISGAIGEGFGWLWQAHILDNFTLPLFGEFGDIIWFGIISGLFTPITLIATEIIRRRVDLADNDALVRTLQFVFGSMIFSILLFAISNVFLLTLVGVLLTRMLMSMRQPLIDAWSNQHIDSNVRATVLSIQGQVNSLGEVAGGPLVGFVGTLSSIRVALSLSTLILLPLIPAFRRSLERNPNART